jgi:hypothetical protein
MARIRAAPGLEGRQLGGRRLAVAEADEPLSGFGFDSFGLCHELAALRVDPITRRLSADRNDQFALSRDNGFVARNRLSI